MIVKAFERAHEIASKFRASADVPHLIAAKKTGTTGELYIYAPIGESWWSEGVTAKHVVEKLEELKGVSKLIVRINSEGGSVWDGKAIENAIRRFDAAEKETHVDGLAASAATFIAMACPKVVMAANATFMIHEAATMASGRACDMRAVADMLEKENRTIAETYARKTGKGVDECLAMMSAETWMSAAEAKEAGFADEIEHGDEHQEEHREKAAAASPLKIAALMRETDDRTRLVRLRQMRERLSGATPGASPGVPGAACGREAKNPTPHSGKETKR